MNRIEETIQKADEAFWKVIVEEYPESISGDFDFGMAAALRKTQTEAVEHWLDYNVPKKCNECGSRKMHDNDEGGKYCYDCGNNQ